MKSLISRGLLSAFFALMVAGASAADLQSLQVARRQTEIQLTLAQQQLASARRTLDTDTAALKEKTDAENRMTYLGRDRIGAKKFQKGTGDPAAQTAIAALQIKVMTDTKDVSNREALVNQLQQQIAALDIQIVALDPNWKPTKSVQQPLTPAKDVISISNRSSRGFTMGPIPEGTIIRLQYLEGKWKSWGRVASGCPDSAADVGGDGRGGERNRLVLANVRPGGTEQVLAIVPPDTAAKPFEFTAPTNLEDVILRINDTDGNYGTNPPGTVKYRLTINASIEKQKPAVKTSVKLH